MIRLLISSLLGFLVTATFAHASVRSLAIGNVEYQANSWIIEVTGTLPNPCLLSPAATLVANPERPNSFVLQVVAEAKSDMCAQVVRGAYRVDADLRQLMKQTGVRIEPTAEYEVVAPGVKFSARFSGQDLLASVQTQRRVEGTLLLSRAGHLALLTAANKLILIDDSLVVARPLLNHQVSVSGHFASPRAEGRQMDVAAPVRGDLPMQLLVATSIELLN